jgi:hypothetical protein
MERAAVLSTKWLASPGSRPSQRGQDAEEVAVPKKQNVARQGKEPPDHPVGADADIRDRFAARAAVTEKTPAGLLAADLIVAVPRQVDFR